MLNLYCTSRHIIAQDQKWRIIFLIEDAEKLRKITKEGVKLALENPYKKIDCDTMKIEE